MKIFFTTAAALNIVTIAMGSLFGVQVFAQSPHLKHDPSNTVGTYSVSQTGRPLAEILLQLQQAFLSPINYEEVPYESPLELKTVTIPTLHGPKQLMFTPKTNFSATLSQDESTPYLALHSVLSRYKTAGLYAADGYQIVQQANRIDVLPSQVLGANASLHKVIPVTSYPVTFPLSERTVEETLTLLFQQVSNMSRKKVILMSDPFVTSNTKITVGAIAELPGDVLAKIGDSVGATLSYQCLFDASDSAYYINIYPVAASVTGSLYNNPAPGTAQSARSVFFTKDLP